MSTIAKLIAGIGLNADEFKRGISDVKGTTGGLEGAFSGLKSKIAAAFSVAAVMKATQELVQYADAVQDAVQTTGAAATAIQTLNAVAQDNATSAEKMKSGLEKVRNAQIDALAGNEGLRSAFERLGISMQQIEGVGADRVFELIGASIVNAKDQAGAMSAAADILGNKMVAQLMPSLKAVGTEGLEALTQRMKDSGRVMDEDMIAKLAAFNDWLDALKTKLLTFATETIQFFQRLGGGLKNFFDPNTLATFEDGWDSVAEKQKAAAQAAIAAAKESNAAIRQAETEKVQWVADGVDYLAKIRAEYAKQAADVEIAEARRAAGEQQRLLGELANSQRLLIEAAREKHEAELTPEQKMQELLQLRIGVLQAIRTLETDGMMEPIKKQTEMNLLKALLIKTEGEIEKATRESSKSQRDEINKNKNLTADQVEALSGLQKLLKDMTDKELADFIQKIQQLHKAVGNLDFSGLLGLQALQGFSIPNESVQNAAQFGRALAAMAEAMKGLTLPDLSGLEVLKGFKIPNESVLNARQFGRAISEMIQELNRTPLDLAQLEKVADLFAALKSGTIQLQIAAPPRDEMQLSVDPAFNLAMQELAGSAKIIASMQGVIFK